MQHGVSWVRLTLTAGVAGGTQLDSVAWQNTAWWSAAWRGGTQRGGVQCGVSQLGALGRRSMGVAEHNTATTMIVKFHS